MKLIQNTPCTLVTGFLGAGKTTAINQLLTHKTAAEKWGLLINEFGQIGIDGKLIDDGSDCCDGIAIREVNGGCICCTSQLPLQIALSRLLGEHTPHRLVIEPTGLAHPKALIEQLSQPHWQTSLSMQAVICVLSANQWQDNRYRENDGYQSHVQYADAVLINRYGGLSNAEVKQLTDWIKDVNPNADIVWSDDAEQGSENLYTKIQQTSQVIQREREQQRQQVRVSLAPLAGASGINTLAPSQEPISTDDTTTDATEIELPYRYHDYQKDIGMAVGGWRLPASWIFKHYELQEWLLALPDWQRIKAVVNTDDGWMRFNFTPDSITTTNCTDQPENQLEVILMLSESLVNDTTVNDINVSRNNDQKTDPKINQEKTALEKRWHERDKQLLALRAFAG